MRPTRRQVLIAMSATATASVLGSGVVVWKWWDRPPGANLQALSNDEYHFVQALAEAWMPAGGEPSLSGSDAQIGHMMDDLVAAMPRGQGNELKLLLQVLDDFPIPRRLSPFRALALDTRTEILAGWLASKNHLLRTGCMALIALIASAYTTHPIVAERMREWYVCGYGA